MWFQTSVAFSTHRKSIFSTLIANLFFSPAPLTLFYGRAIWPSPPPWSLVFPDDILFLLACMHFSVEIKETTSRFLTFLILSVKKIHCVGQKSLQSQLTNKVDSVWFSSGAIFWRKLISSRLFHLSFSKKTKKVCFQLNILTFWTMSKIFYPSQKEIGFPKHQLGIIQKFWTFKIKQHFNLII